MEKRPDRRLKIWDLADSAQGPAKPERASHSTRYRDVSALTDLASSYDLWAPLLLEIDGTCRLPGLSELKCKTKTVSPAVATFALDDVGAEVAAAADKTLTGQTAHLDLESIGTVHGRVAAQSTKEFSVAIDEDCKDLLRDRLSKIAKDRDLQFEERPAKLDIVRIEPLLRNCVFTDGTGALRKGKIVNLSQIDILIRTAIIPARNSYVIFKGQQQRLATIARSFETGFAAGFCTPIPAGEFSAGIKFVED
jgi:hypothetical protein